MGSRNRQGSVDPGSRSADQCCSARGRAGPDEPQPQIWWVHWTSIARCRGSGSPDPVRHSQSMMDQRFPHSPTGFEVACEMAAFAERIFEAGYRRRHPDAADEEVRKAIVSWRSERPGAPDGDAIGRVRTL
ncbi:MAG: hypothetical protein ACK5LN_12240 [Propioniciclava sp.]